MSARHAQGLLLVALALAAHGSGLANGFVYDDHRFVVGNPALASLEAWEALTEAAAHTADRDRDVYRPLRALGHAFDLRRWGLDPFGFHLHSVLLHVLTVLAAWWALQRLLPGSGPWPPLLGAGVLATHPLGVEVVGWVSSRGDGYALLFALLALGAARSSWRGAAVIAGGAALLATLGKESAAVLPVVAWLAGRLVGPRRPAAVGALALGVALALALRQTALAGATPVQTPPHGGSWLAQAGWAFHGLARTLGHLVLPTGLSLDYPQDEWARGVSVWLRPSTWIGVVAAVLPALGARRWPRAAFLAGWALLAYLPSSSLLVTLRSLVTDRGAYPLLAPAGALLGLALSRSPRLAAAVLGLVALAGIATSHERTEDFRSDEALWQDVLDKNPASVQAHLGLAVARPEATGRHLREAVRVAVPGSKPAAVALARLGDHVLRVERDAAGAEPVLRQALVALRHWAQLERPLLDEPVTAATLAEALAELGRWDEADELLQDAARRDALPAALLVKLAVLRHLRAQAAEDEASRRAAEQSVREALAAAEAADPQHPLVVALRDWLDGHRPRPP